MCVCVFYSSFFLQQNSFSFPGKLVFEENEVLAYLKRFYGNVIEDAEPFRFQPRPAAAGNAAGDAAPAPGQRPPGGAAGADAARARQDDVVRMDNDLDMRRNSPQQDVDGSHRGNRVHSNAQEPNGVLGDGKSVDAAVARDALLTDELRLAAASRSGLTGIDLSLCVAFYVMCTAILILIYYHFTVNRRMSLTGAAGKLFSKV